jgi:hypothetical protein
MDNWQRARERNSYAIGSFGRELEAPAIESYRQREANQAERNRPESEAFQDARAGMALGAVMTIVVAVVSGCPISSQNACTTVG